jgi:hypothetical protein
MHYWHGKSIKFPLSKRPEYKYRLKDVKALKFDDLSSEAKKKALDDNRDINVDYDWWEMNDGLWHEDFKEMGIEGQVAFDVYHGEFDVDKVKIVDRKKFAKYFGIPSDLVDSAYFSTTQYGGGDFKTRIDADYDAADKYDTAKIENANTKWYDFKKKALKRISDSYNYLQSDESIADTLRANDFEFTPEGKRA